MEVTAREAGAWDWGNGRGDGGGGVERSPAQSLRDLYFFTDFEFVPDNALEVLVRPACVLQSNKCAVFFLFVGSFCVAVDFGRGGGGGRTVKAKNNAARGGGGGAGGLGFVLSIFYVCRNWAARDLVLVNIPFLGFAAQKRSMFFFVWFRFVCSKFISRSSVITWWSIGGGHDSPGSDVVQFCRWVTARFGLVRSCFGGVRCDLFYGRVLVGTDNPSRDVFFPFFSSVESPCRQNREISTLGRDR